MENKIKATLEDLYDTNNRAVNKNDAQSALDHKLVIESLELASNRIKGVSDSI